MTKQPKKVPAPKPRRNWATIVIGLVIALAMAAFLVTVVLNNVKRGNHSMGSFDNDTTIRLELPSGMNFARTS